jgi:hypothetical protein
MDFLRNPFKSRYRRYSRYEKDNRLKRTIEKCIDFNESYVTICPQIALSNDENSGSIACNARVLFKK